MVLTADNFTAVFWIAVVPGFLAFALVIFAVEEPARNEGTAPPPTLHWSHAKRLPMTFWTLVAIASVLTLARFSEAFLVLRAQNVGLPIALVPIVMVVMNVVYASAAYPAGALSDAIGRNAMLALGIIFLIVADLVLAFGSTIPLVLLGVVLWGLHMGFTQGLLAALVADVAPPELRGTAFGLFNFACGISMLIASVVAGALWDAHGPAATFVAGAIFTTLALLGLAIVQRRLRQPSQSVT
jgi:MFS family permease